MIYHAAKTTEMFGIWGSMYSGSTFEKEGKKSFYMKWLELKHGHALQRSADVNHPDLPKHIKAAYR